MKTLRLAFPVVLVLLVAGCGFAAHGANPLDPPGFFQGAAIIAIIVHIL